MWWTQSIEKVSEKLGTDPKRGLSQADAEQRQKEHGPNKLREAKPISAFSLFLEQFSSFIVWVLIVAAAVAALLGEWIDTIAIAVIVVLNAILGFVQEFRAEKSLAALKKLATPNSKVIREGNLQTIPSDELIPGDLVLLEAGDRIPADGRLIDSVHLSTQEASLTGESTPIHKKSKTLAQEKLPIGDRENMVFMGTVVAGGKGHMLITAIAHDTELGQIATLLEKPDDEKTPLQKRLTKLGHRLVYICLIIVLALFILGFFQGLPLIDIIMTSLSLAVAAIPEGLPAIVTISLALGVRRMVRRNALIRRLASVETLGSATVICTDKTGTLTQNKMAVRKIFVNHSFIDVSGIGYRPEGEFEENEENIDPKKNRELLLALKIGVLCNNANLNQNEEAWEITGDPTEGALLVAAAKANLKKEELEENHPLLDEIPFDSEKKWMAMLRETDEGATFFIKGAPDVILEHSFSIQIDGEIKPLTNELKEQILNANHELASQALRVLAVAYRKTSEHTPEAAAQELTFVALLAMIDPPREEAKKAIATCKQAGIKTVMITGDHRDTAVAIAKELGLMSENEEAVTGSEVDQMSDEQLKEQVRNITVYARTTAEHKIRIIHAWKELGEIVAMTGDGVNDAPAVKEADIGISMGITGTEVTKEASDMVILDDNFASIVNAVEEGRGIYDNIMKFVRYLLTSNIAEILVIFVGMLMNLKDPAGNSFIALLPVQLLWINLITDGFPAVALGMDPIDPTAMQRPPRDPNERILSRYVMTRFFAISVLMAAGTLYTCMTGLKISAEYGHTFAFTTLVVMELVKVQVIRSQYHIGLFSNPWLIIALIGSLALQMMVVYIPSLQVIFGTVALSLSDWGFMAIIAFIVGVLAQLILKIT